MSVVSANETSLRPAFERAQAAIREMNRDAAPRVVRGLVVVAIIAEANAIDAAAERHRGGGHD